MHEEVINRLVTKVEMLKDQAVELANNIKEISLTYDTKSPSNKRDKFAEIALSIIGSRRTIGEIFDPIIFADPATNIMLQLYSDKVFGRQSNSGYCCKVSGVPRTTALRLMNLLSDRNLIEMRVLNSDRRLTAVQITQNGYLKVEKWLETLTKIINI